MRCSMLRLTLLFALPALHPNDHIVALAFPQYASLAGLSARQLAEVLPTLQAPPDIRPPPGPMNDTSTKLVNDEKHPYIPPGPDDIRGPCPAMNTLANHGYIPRNGIARPSQIVAGVQEAFNMGNDLAKAQVYGSHVLGGNLITDLISIGQKTSLTGTDPPHTTAGGLSEHNKNEGDASVSRADSYFGDNHSFNETVFQQFVRASKKSPDGRFDHNVAVDLRYQRYKESVATNPNFDYPVFRYFAAFNEAVFIYLFVDGRSNNSQRLDMDVARSFFQLGKMPHDFHRANQPLSSLGNSNQVRKLQKAVSPELRPGKNNGTVNSFIAMPAPLALSDCGGYGQSVNTAVQGYGNVTGDLLNSLKKNLHYFYEGFIQAGCTELFPYGEL